jgi:hypothetical protein
VKSLPVICLIGALALLGGCAEEPVGDPEVDAYSVQLGQCTGPISVGEEDRLTVLDCATEHYWEAFAQTALDAEKYPGNAKVTEEAGVFCEAAFADFVGVKVNKSNYSLTFLQPTEETWEAGDRDVLCLAGSAGGQVTGSLEGLKK